MKLFKRFRDGLFNPYNVNNYIDDKKGFTVIFFFILVILMVLPSAISTIASPIVDYEDKAYLRETFYHDEAEVPFYINSNILFNTNRDNNFVYKKEIGNSALIIMKANDDVTTYARYSTIIEFSRTGVFIHQFGIRRLLCSYKDYFEFSNMKFSDAYNNDGEFWQNIFSIIDKEVPKQEVLYKTMNIVLVFIATSFSLALWSLIFSVFNKSTSTKKMSFGKFWQLMIYLITPYAVLYTMSKMFGLNLLYYLGLGWTIVNIFRFSRKVVIIKGDDNDEL